MWLLCVVIYYRYIFFCGRLRGGFVKRINIDGTDQTMIVQTMTLIPQGLAIDHEEEILYFIDAATYVYTHGFLHNSFLY